MKEWGIVVLLVALAAIAAFFFLRQGPALGGTGKVAGGIDFGRLWGNPTTPGGTTVTGGSEPLQTDLTTLHTGGLAT